MVKYGTPKRKECQTTAGLSVESAVYTASRFRHPISIYTVISRDIKSRHSQYVALNRRSYARAPSIFTQTIPSGTSSFRLLRLPIHHGVILIKLQTDAIHTVPLVRRRIIALSLEHMPQVPATVTAHDLRPCHAERRVRVPRHRARDRVEVRRPPTAGLELVICFVEGSRAGGARVHAGIWHGFVERVREGGLGAFFAEDAELL